MASGGNTVPHITKAEHIGPNDTGDNIEAKRVAAYGWDGSNWERMGVPAINEHFDYIGVVNSATDQDTLTYKTGGSGGTTVKTLVIGYAAGAEKVSESIASLSFS